MSTQKTISTLILIIISVLLLSGASCGRRVGDDRMQQALKNLDISLGERDKIIKARGKEIDLLKDSLKIAKEYHERVVIYDRIYDLMRHFNIDSTLCYYNKAREEAKAHGDAERDRYCELRTMELLPLKTFIHEGITIMDTTDVSALSVKNRIEYYKGAYRICMYLTSIYSPYYTPSAVNFKYLNRIDVYCDSLLSMMSPRDKGYNLYRGASYMVRNNLSLGIATLLEELNTLDVMDPMYNDVVSMLMLTYFLRGRYDDWAYCVALGARAENEQAILDGELLRQLGRWVYNKGDAATAYDYMVIAEDNWAKSGAVVRNVHVPDVLPLIGEAFRDSERESKVLLALIVGCLLVILILICVIFYRRAKERSELAASKEELAKSNAVKEAYIGRFMSLCYIYMDKMEEVTKIVSRKLAAGQIEDLYHMMKTGKLEDEQRQLFYKEFDDAFIHIYPTFINDVNALMKDSVKLGDAEGGHLTPELRILAFMRLGIDDSSKIARFLNLSVNTVYTYRNRMKNRALNRDEFERQVMLIGRL